MLTGPTNTGGDVQTADCFRVGGCSQPPAQQDKYEVAQNEYNTGVERRRRQKPRIELANDYERTTTQSYEIDCIDCDQVSEDTIEYRNVPERYPAEQYPQTGGGEEDAHRSRGWSTWDSWGSRGAEYHESEGYRQRPNRPSPPTYYNQAYNTGQNALNGFRNMGTAIKDQIGKYSYSMGCFYVSC